MILANISIRDNLSRRINILYKKYPKLSEANIKGIVFAKSNIYSFLGNPKNYESLVLLFLQWNKMFYVTLLLFSTTDAASDKHGECFH
jgi:hypothetical protein